MATQVLSQIANYLATVPLQRKQQQYENELANRRLALQEDESARKAEADRLALENAQFEQQQRNEGQQQLRDYYQAAEIQPAINELKQGKELTKNIAPYSMDYLLAQPEATPLALTDKYKLSQYSGYNEGVKGTLDKLRADEEQRIKESKTAVGLGMATQLKRADWNKIAAMPDGEEKDKAIDDYMMVYAPGSMYGLTEKGIDEAINRERRLIAPKADAAAAEKTAKDTAPARMPDKDVNELTGQQNVYNNLLDVKNKFDSKYLTPYIGKGIKMAFLKQNDPEFSDFQSSLALALNEYRRQNFGTAQTQSELENFLDVINSNLNISPESFNKQLNVIMSAMQRDFNNKTKTKEQQNYIIPDNLRSIEIPKTTTNLSQRDQDAIDWANKNMSDPRAKKILQIHGM